MSFAPKAVSGNPSPSTAQTARPAPKKEDAKATVTGQVALSALAEASIRTLVLPPALEASPAKKAEAVQNAMSLIQTASGPSNAQIPAFFATLKPQEESLLF
jgi:hypothetical protein